MVFLVSLENVTLDTCFLSEFFLLYYAASHGIYPGLPSYKAAGDVGPFISMED